MSIFIFLVQLKAKDTPWDAVLMGSVACTVDAKLNEILTNAKNGAMCINLFTILYFDIRRMEDRCQV